MFKRTAGVSTTDIIGKLLSLTKNNTVKAQVTRDRANSMNKVPMTSKTYVDEVKRVEEETLKVEEEENKGRNSARAQNPEESKNALVSALQAQDPMGTADQNPTSMLPQSNFLATTRRIMHFSSNKEPGPDDKVVYLAGSFDCLHNGHIELIKKAKE
jgi:hypothetical protein